MAEDLPKNIEYWITSPSNHDCAFRVGQEPELVETIGAVKIFLIGHSKMFQTMLGQSDTLVITDSDPETFRNFLKCVYGGTKMVLLKLTFEECLKVLCLCVKYHVSEVRREVSSCMLELHRPLTTRKVLTVLSNPATLQDNSITSEIKKVVQNETETILDDEIFMSLDARALIFIANQPRLSIKEIDLWKAFLRWAQEKVSTDNTQNDLRSCFGNTIKFIRFCTMEGQEFCTHVVSMDVLTSEEVHEICKSIGNKTPPNLENLSTSIERRFKKSRTEIMFHYVLNNISEFNREEHSKEMYSGGFEWFIALKKEGNEETSLGVYLNCKPKKGRISPRWKKCYATVELILVNHFNNTNKSKTFDTVFTKESPEAEEVKEFVSWDDLVDRESGFVKNNSIEVIVKVEYLSTFNSIQ